MNRRINNRKGMTLLELIIASSMLAMLLTAVTVVLRTAHSAWQAEEGDFAKLQSLQATLRQIVRQVRQAGAVTAISAANNTSGSLTITLWDGSSLSWARDNATNNVYCDPNSPPTQLLATDITSLTFAGYMADGVTLAATPDQIHSLQIQAQVQLPRETNGARTITTWVWLRSWH